MHVIVSTYSISAVPRQTVYSSANENKAMKTHVQSCLGSFFVSGVGGKSLIDDSVGAFTVETNTTIRRLH